MAKRSGTAARTTKMKASKKASGKRAAGKKRRSSNNSGNVTYVFLNGGTRIDYSEVTKAVDELKKLTTTEAIEAQLQKIEDEKGATFRQAVAVGIAPHMIVLNLRFTRNWVQATGNDAIEKGSAKVRRGLGWLGGVLGDLGKSLQESAGSGGSNPSDGGGSKS